MCLFDAVPAKNAKLNSFDLNVTNWGFRGQFKKHKTRNNFRDILFDRSSLLRHTTFSTEVPLTIRRIRWNWRNQQPCHLPGEKKCTYSGGQKNQVDEMGFEMDTCRTQSVVKGMVYTFLYTGGWCTNVQFCFYRRRHFRVARSIWPWKCRRSLEMRVPSHI